MRVRSVRAPGGPTPGVLLAALAWAGACGGGGDGEVEPLPAVVTSRGGQVTIEWDPHDVVARIEAFSLRRAREAEGPFDEFYLLDRSLRSFRDVTFAAGDRWFYQVAGVDGAREVALSEPGPAASTIVLPETVLEEAPAAVLDTNEARFRWSGLSLREDNPVDRFTWRLDGGWYGAPEGARDLVLRALPAGRHRLEVRAIDARGNLDPTPAAADFEVRLARAPGVLVNDGEVASADRAVRLRLRALGVAEVRVSEDSDLRGAEWRPMAASLPFELSEGEGPKTVYAQFRTAAGEATAVVADDIVYDRTPPAGSVEFPPALGEDGLPFGTQGDTISLYGRVQDHSPVTARALGERAEVQAGTFHILEVPLDLGQNLIDVTLTDAVGLRETLRVEVWRHPAEGQCAF